MSAVWYRAQADVRRRWRSALLLIAIVGLAGAAVLATVAGAGRSTTAYDRFRDETLAADLDIAFDGPPPGDPAAAASAIRELPQVEVLTRTVFPFVVPAGSGFYPYLDFLAIAGLDDAFGREIDRPRVLEGRTPEPERANEIAITNTYPREAALDVGDRLEFESFAPEQLEPLFETGDAGAPSGPRFTLDVVGIFGAPDFLSESTGSFQPRVFLAAAFVVAHADEVATYPGGFKARLRNGPDDVPAVSAALREMFDSSTALELTPASEIDAKISPSIDVIVVALALCALAAAIAGCVAVAQALARYLSADAVHDRSLSALGMTRRERGLARVAGTVPIALGGAVVAVAGAVAASPVMPVGVARQAEPRPGLSVDGHVLGLGFVGVVLVVLVLAGLAAVAVDRRGRLAADGRDGHRASRVMHGARVANLPPPAAIGVGMALDPRAGTGSAVRSALGGVTFGTVGVIAVVVFAASVDALVVSPDRYGAPFDAIVSGFSGDVLAQGGDDLSADPDIEGLGVLTTGLVRIGQDEVNSHAFQGVKGNIALTILDGRAPTGRGEVVLGDSTLDDADAKVGESIEITGAARSLEVTIVGTAAFPVVDERSSASRGTLFDQRDLERISSPDELNRDVIVRWSNGTDAARANSTLSSRTGTEVSTPRLPSEVNNLRQARSLPRALAVFLGLLAALAAAHALLSTVQIRRHDLAVLRTLGFQGRQLAAVTGWQATTIAAVGLILGIPLGLLLGRLVWRAVAGGIGVVDTPVIPALAVVIVAAATLLVTTTTAIVSGRVARSVRPASVLRAG